MMKKYLKCSYNSGGNIGLNLAKMLEENFEDIRIKIIEKDKKRAKK